MPRTAARESAACRSPSASVISRRRQSASSSSPPALRWAGSHSTSQQQQPRFLASLLASSLFLFLFSLLVCCERTSDSPQLLLLFTLLFSSSLPLPFPCLLFPSYRFLPLLNHPFRPRNGPAQLPIPFQSASVFPHTLTFQPLTHPEVQFELQTSLPAPRLQANAAWGGGQDWPAGRVTG